MAEIHTPLQFREEANLPSRGWAQNYQRRTQEVADESGIGTLEARKLKMPTTTNVLRSIERHNGDPNLPGSRPGNYAVHTRTESMGIHHDP